MKVVFAPRAEADLAHHLSHGIQRLGHAVAGRTLQRLQDYLDPFLVTYPRTATFHPQINAFETWVPKTPFVIFFRIEPDHEVLRVLAIFRHAQDRSPLDPDTDA